jgi:hypothetical protein
LTWLYVTIVSRDLSIKEDSFAAKETVAVLSKHAVAISQQRTEERGVEPAVSQNEYRMRKGLKALTVVTRWDEHHND